MVRPIFDNCIKQSLSICFGVGITREGGTLQNVVLNICSDKIAGLQSRWLYCKTLCLTSVQTKLPACIQGDCAQSVLFDCLKILLCKHILNWLNKTVGSIWNKTVDVWINSWEVSWPFWIFQKPTYTVMYQCELVLTRFLTKIHSQFHWKPSSLFYQFNLQISLT